MSPRRLSRAQRWALGASAGLAVGLAAYGAAGSYETVTGLAAEVGVPLPGLVPVGIDGGLVGVVVLDLVLAWTGQPVGWLRQFARLLTVGTVAANVSAGWPDPVAVGLHSAAPVLLLVMVEAGRAVLLRRVGYEMGEMRDRIPLGRWVLSPVRTWLLWRRMVLWQITNYREALEAELDLRRACASLRMTYGRRWKRKAPGDLVWMLRTGVLAQEACVHARSLAVEVPVESASGQVGAARDAAAPTAGQGVADSALLVEVERLNERHWAQRGRPVSAETVRKHLRVGATKARALTRAVRNASRMVVDAPSSGVVETRQPQPGTDGSRLHHALGMLPVH
ncbi:DUF2637 domain-containing protein [Kibdelosporangium philippinense]|uniref:DUF2637 domain-containing protein n=1 Tax=Kibdelosporangium philippinense TaxID=211113 RepID=A0ABS8ZKA0_9PSEU|nr:DUF2637 domain-containing protein [Kibdelosporangium philippinense]MCE7007061.1 DUF2637 domain-containing protein [Kibdelosporangium philippinense]